MTEPSAESAEGEPRILHTDTAATDGLAKCARCGATDIGFDITSSQLRCRFCRYQWQTASVWEKFGIEGGLGQLSGMVVGSGAANIAADATEVVTFKCGACGAQVVVDTRDATQARCHWCRNYLSVNQQIDNGVIPDMLLPFALDRDTAVPKIANFVGKRRFFAHPRFRREFSAENVMGVYLPYMNVDLNAHATLRGRGEHQLRSYTIKRGKSRKRVYDASVYRITRDFDIHINDLTVESSQERMDLEGSHESNNIINAIMPFDMNHAVLYDANYLAGFSSERRDMNIAGLTPLVETQTKDVTRNLANETVKYYDRGVHWRSQDVDLQGQRWLSAYLPVWLYSYYERKSNGKSFLHYVAVNGRTGKTMGSVPVNQGRLVLVSAAVQVVCTALAIMFALVV